MLSCSTSSKEDFREDFEEEEEDLEEEEAAIVNLSSVTIVGYLDITIEISHTCSVHVCTILQLIILSRTSHS